MPALSVVTLLCLLLPPSAADWAGVVVEARGRAPVAGAEVTVVGVRGAVRTDAVGRFRWPGPRPPAPVTIVVILPDGRVARPIRVTAWESAGDAVLVAEAALAEAVTIAGVAPTIDSSPGASTTFVPGPDVELRAPSTLSQALEDVPGVSFISEGQGAVPAIGGWRAADR